MTHSRTHTARPSTSSQAFSMRPMIANAPGE